MSTWRRSVFLLCGLVFLRGTCRAEDSRDSWIRFDEGWWRLDLAYAPPGVRQPRERDHDSSLIGSVEYEFRIFHRSTLALRAVPLFYYYEDEDRPGGEGSIFGAGAGLRYRIYWETESRSGPFLEAGSFAFRHNPALEGNSSRVNFLSEGGIGYQFRGSPWSLGVLYTHISNAGLGSENERADGLAFTAGYRF